MKTIFLTGATGNMGFSAMKEILSRSDRFKLKILARPSKKNKKKLRPFLDNPALEVIWGDLTVYEDILKGVNGSDFVLHLGGMVSPAADLYPEKTMKVNIRSAEYIVKAVKAQPHPDSVGVLYIGSVAQLGDHRQPYHWGRSGDPIYTSIFDWYSVSKVVSELVFAEAGLKKWASIRQSGMLYPELLKKADDPITYHVPLNGVLEWSTVEDSGRVVANVCEDWVPQEFWRGFYNLSSGPSYRLTNYQFEDLLLKTINCPGVEKVFEPNWFATRNFHGEWYEDSDRLEELLHFRDNIHCKEYFKKMKRELPWYFSLAPIAPAFLIKAFMKHICSSNPLGTLYWIKNNNTARINAHFGSLEQWKAIPSWKGGFKVLIPENKPVRHSHGYDESKPDNRLGIEDMREAAAFRGGKLISESMTEGDLFTPLEWECSRGHRFKMTPNSVIKGGHWCPDCLPAWEEGRKEWHFDEIAEKNKFFAQVYRK